MAGRCTIAARTLVRSCFAFAEHEPGWRFFAGALVCGAATRAFSCVLACLFTAAGTSTDGVPDVLEVEIIDNAEDYVKQIQHIFDVPKLRALLARPDFKFVYDGMHGGEGLVCAC